MSLKRMLLRTQLRAAGWRGIKAARRNPTAAKQDLDGIQNVAAVRSGLKLKQVRRIGEIVDTSTSQESV